MSLETLKKRAQFQHLTHAGRRMAMPAFILQGSQRVPSDDAPARMGYTVSKKVGNAVERNRVKRRLRALVQATGECAHFGWDFVLVGRRAALHRPFEDMKADLVRAYADIERGKKDRKSS